MTRWIVGSSLRLRALVLAIGAGLLVFGIVQLREAPVDVLPEFTPPYVEIQTEALGLSADEVEELITAPMEADLLNGVEGVSAIRSKSVPGLSSVTLVFEQGSDLYRERQLVQERLNQAHALPQVSKPPEMLQPLSSESRVLMVGLSAPHMPLVQQGVLARWTVRPRLMGVPGVANVEIWGQRERQLQVQVDPRRLRRHDVSLLDIISTAGNAQFVSNLTFLEGSTPGTGGFVETRSQRLGIQHVFPTSTAEDLAKVPVEGARRGLRLGDVTNVVEDHQPLIGDAVGKDGPGLLLVVEKVPKANTLDVTRGVEQALRELRPGLSGMEADTSVFRPATYVEKSIDNLTWALVAGVILLALVLAGFLLQWRAVAIALATMALSIVTAAVVLDLLGATFNALVVAGLAVAVAVVIDDAVTGAEAAARRLRERGDRGAAAIVLETTLETRRPLAFATLIVLLAVVPLLFLDGVSSHMFGPLARAYALAVLASMLVALTVAPALTLALYARARSERRVPQLARSLSGAYDAALARVAHSPAPAFLGVGVIAFGGLAAAHWLDHSSEPALLPRFQERTLLVHWSGPPGTSLPEMNRVVGRAIHELRAVRGVEDVGVNVGRAISADQVVNVNSAEIWVNLEKDADYDATVRSVREVVGGYPGLRHGVTTYSQQRLRDVAAMEDGRDDNHDGRDDGVLTTATEDGSPTAGKDLLVRLYGHDDALLQRKAEEVRRAVAGIDGVVSPTVEHQIRQPTLEIKVDIAAARAHGLKPGDVRRAASTLVSGLTVGSLFEKQKVFDVVVWGTPPTRNSIGAVRNLLIDTPDGGHVRLADVAQTQLKPAPATIRREAVQRRLDVGLNVDGRGLGAVRADVEHRVAGISFPLEYHAEVLSPSAERHAADRRIAAIAIAAAIGIFLLLQAALGSWRLASIVLLTLPLAVAGGAIAAWIDGGVLTLGSLAGMFAVLAIAARHGIAVAGRIQGGADELPDDEVVIERASSQLLPVITTAAATAAVLAPFAVLGARPGLEIVHPMAIVVLGGLLTSTVAILLVLPALCLWFASGPARVRAGARVAEDRSGA